MKTSSSERLSPRATMLLYATVVLASFAATIVGAHEPINLRRRQLSVEDKDEVNNSNDSNDLRNTQMSFSYLHTKMNAKPVAFSGEDSPFAESNKDFVEGVNSRVAFFIGECSSNKPFEFVIGGRSGRCAIGTPSASIEEPTSFVTSVNLVDPNEEGEIIQLTNKVESNFFATPAFTESSDSFIGALFGYHGMTSKELSTVQVLCSSDDPVDIIVVVGDDTRESIDASVTHLYGSSNLRVDLNGKAKSNKDLHSEPITSIAHPSGRSRHLSSIEASPTSILLEKKINTRSLFDVEDVYEDNESATHCTLIQMTTQDSEENDIPRTLVVCSGQENSGRRSRKLQSSKHDDEIIKLESADIDENGDVIFKFASLQEEFELSQESVLKFDARIGITSTCLGEDAKTIEVVDMNVMLHAAEPTLVVNGGWFRRATKMHDLTDCEWEPIFIGVVITDPEAKYSQLGRLNRPIKATIMNNNSVGRGRNLNEFNKRRLLLKAPPTQDELNINDEMTRGRKPENLSPSSSRKLQAEIHKKILVHGYCSSGNHFPISHFTQVVAFDDIYSSGPQNWSNNQFALKIRAFADNEGITGCGIIAHSQGGMAALHLERYYWSCLDYSNTGGSRKIQSVGTPYRGSALAGSLAAIGEVFGQSCGYNSDLTESGAVNWLSGIPSSNRNQVHYYTTSNKKDNKWWTWDAACHWASDLILSDPDDGAIEKARGQLNNGGNNKGHQKGQCHVSGMDGGSAQTKDRNRNGIMNSNAKY